MKIYIASPYTEDTEEERLANVHKAIDAGIEVYRLGHIPYIPHLSHWLDKRATEIGQPLEWKDYMEIGIEWLRECDALLYLGSSKGADIELYCAKALGLKIYYSVKELLNKVHTSGKCQLWPKEVYR